jgi:hypothetical protein
MFSYLRSYLALRKILDKVFMKLGMNVTALTLLLAVFLHFSPRLVIDNFTYSEYLHKIKLNVSNLPEKHHVAPCILT